MTEEKTSLILKFFHGKFKFTSIDMIILIFVFMLGEKFTFIFADRYLFVGIFIVTSCLCPLLVIELNPTVNMRV